MNHSYASLFSEYFHAITHQHTLGTALFSRCFFLSSSPLCPLLLRRRPNLLPISVSAPTLSLSTSSLFPSFLPSSFSLCLPPSLSFFVSHTHRRGPVWISAPRTPLSEGCWCLTPSLQGCLLMGMTRLCFIIGYFPNPSR